LQRWRGADEFIETLLERALAEAKLSAADRGLCQELVYGVVRWQAALDWLVARKTPGRTQKAGLQDLLRLGLYQIFFLDRIPGHAAVNETVEMAKRRGFGAQAGFINAVLRGYLREHDETDRMLASLKTSQPALGWSHPEWLVARWQNRWDGERTRQLLEWNNTPPKMFARVNTLKFIGTRVSEPQRVGRPVAAAAETGALRKMENAGDLLTQWRDESVEYDFIRRDWFDENLVFELKAHPPLASLPSFQRGLFYVQDPSTLLAVRELDPRPGETILDFCAAPGGKTTFIAQTINNQGRIVAQDVSRERLKLIEENCARLAVTCVETTLLRLSAHPLPSPLPEGEVGNAAALGESSASVEFPSAETAFPSPSREGQVEGKPGENPTGCDFSVRHSQFDKVLVDAPCSNTGVMRRRVDLRWRIQPEAIQRLRAMQLELLRQAALAVKAGGALVYSTCSLEPEENSEVVKAFLSQQPGFNLERERELLPFADGVDGAFVARLKRGSP